VAYDFDSWQEISQLRAQYEHERHDWSGACALRSRCRGSCGCSATTAAAAERQVQPANIYARDRSRCSIAASASRRRN